MIKTLLHCLKCDKELYGDDVHTCIPSKRYRAGMEEGRYKSQQKLEKCIEFLNQMVCVFHNGLDIQCGSAFDSEARKLLQELKND